ncbi:DUF3427 domain-containing protein [Indiicoccus explosivorum]|uniref:DUF3427 domain-containing protein n=1 Tax=Indiicoccus explosivorum TaxID=1917864 RepID=UPI00138FB25F|nr:DUF3427 domain-containing protein [Indiicoccus explosivorum]
MSCLKLSLFHDYSRQDVHNIFGSTSRFVPGSGTWGVHGIIRLSDRPGDYVLFVTFGQDSFGYTFKEGITGKGVLTWQSQKRHSLNHPVIREFINHNSEDNNIHLFLRTSKWNPKTKESRLFTYLGKVSYVTHDKEQENPVFLKWRILNWENIDEGTVSRMALNIDAETVINEMRYDSSIEKKAEGVPEDVRGSSHSTFWMESGNNSNQDTIESVGMEAGYEVKRNGSQFSDFISDRKHERMDTPSISDKLEKGIANIKVGKYVRKSMTRIFMEGDIDNLMIDLLLEKDYCKRTFGINFPLLKEVEVSTNINQQRLMKGKARYWTGTVSHGRRHFLICSQWYERDRRNYMRWETALYKR